MHLPLTHIYILTLTLLLILLPASACKCGDGSKGNKNPEEIKATHACCTRIGFVVDSKSGDCYVNKWVDKYQEFLECCSQVWNMGSRCAFPGVK
ncbi:hypothetical protein FQN51_005999 [Onygenales sp. PD_10]|nr:hypothetical protein FQN51_005999 [Onygenales sp. PD_10]